MSETKYKYEAEADELAKRVRYNIGQFKTTSARYLIGIRDIAQALADAEERGRAAALAALSTGAKA